MRHLSLVPPLATEVPVAPTAKTAVVPMQRPAFEDHTDALAFFQAASGVCLCRDCTKLRHPAYGAR
jgi:hypothetical protein